MGTGSLTTHLTSRALLCMAFAALLAACSPTSTDDGSASAVASDAISPPEAFTGEGAFVVPVDLQALIDAAANNPNQFAVSVPYLVTSESAGTWEAHGDRWTWTHALQIPGAVSLSFHAPNMRLPASAKLVVRSQATTVTYDHSDVERGDLWSRVQPGDTLEFALDVSADERDELVLEIISFQAGFRGLSPEVPDHPSIDKARILAAGDPDTHCVENYACHVTPANSPAAQATVALMIGNQYLCTGTLINNTAQDNTPYILTARHCQNGHYGGGNPSAAGSVTVYWDALSVCGTPLGTVHYGPNSTRQTGATTVLEQQDAWLIKLDASPVVDSAHYAGFDATGAMVSGGYSIHHALAYNKQYTRWFGAARAYSEENVLGAQFTSTLLDTVNDLGVSGPGASGAALFTTENLVAGVLSLGRSHNSISGYGRCPAAAPSPPSPANWESSFVSFGAIWDSAADPTSSTGSRTPGAAQQELSKQGAVDDRRSSGGDVLGYAGVDEQLCDIRGASLVNRAHGLPRLLVASGPRAQRHLRAVALLFTKDQVDEHEDALAGVGCRRSDPLDDRLGALLSPERQHVVEQRLAIVEVPIEGAF